MTWCGYKDWGCIDYCIPEGVCRLQQPAIKEPTCYVCGSGLDTSEPCYGQIQECPHADRKWQTIQDGANTRPKRPPNAGGKDCAGGANPNTGLGKERSNG